MKRLTYFFALAILVTGCARPSSESASSPDEAATAVAFNVAGAPTIEINVPDMMCPEGCGAKTKEILSEQRGAKEVLINFDAKTATVAIEEGQFDADAAIAALVDHGFEHSTLKSNASHTEATAASAEQPTG